MFMMGVSTKLPLFTLALILIIISIDPSMGQRRPSLDLGVQHGSLHAVGQHCYTLCPRGWTKWNNRCYKYFKSRVTGDAAETACVGQGGHLASINSQAEQNFVFNLWQTGGVGPSDSINVTPQNALWIGAKKVSTTWTWSDGSSWNFARWGDCTSPNYPGRVWHQPDNTGACAHMWTHRTTPNGGWNDLYCNSNTYRTYYVCERDSHSCCYPFAPEWPQNWPAPLF